MNSGLPKRIRFTLMLPVVLILSAPVQSASLLDVSELRRGMQGVGRTVFRGTRIDTFQVEILGVLKNAFGPKTNIILAMLSGDPLETTGGIAGMSGSPVYVDGRLIGAVAYGWAFSIEPIMGITPIGEMLEILERPDAAAHTSIGGSTSSLEMQLSNVFSTIPEGLDVGQMQRVKTPVYMSGFSSEVLPGLREAFASFGLLPVQGGGGTDESLPEPTLEPGAALGVQLIRGDFNMTAIGTLTHIEGDRLVGFGHPMLFSGSTRLPMTTAFIHDVVASQIQSFKLGAAVKQVGVITQDRAPGIGGVIGKEAEMMQASISVRSPNRAETFEMEVLRNRELSPLLIQSAVVSSILSAEKARGEATIRTTLKLQIDGRGDALEFMNVYAGSRGLGEGVMGVTRPMMFLLTNPFEKVRVASAEFDLTIDETIEAARIESIRLDRSRFEPGDRVGLTATLRPYLRESFTVGSSVTIPSYFHEGMLTLRVSSARAHLTQESKRIPGYFHVNDLDALIHVLENEHRNDALIVELLANRPGATVNGIEVSSLPPSVMVAMKGSRQSGNVRPVNQTVVSETIEQTDYVLSGQQIVFLSVGKEDGAIRFGPGQSGPGAKKK